MNEFTPETRVVTVDGIVVVQCVNWMDFEGWECRVAEDAERRQSARVLGYVHESEDRWGQHSWTVGKHGEERRGGFRSIEAAIASLL